MESQHQVQLHQWPFVRRHTITTFSLSLFVELPRSVIHQPQRLLLIYCPSANDAATSCLPPAFVLDFLRTESWVSGELSLPDAQLLAFFPFLLFTGRKAGDEIVQVTFMSNRRLSVQWENWKKCWKRKISIWDCSWCRNSLTCWCLDREGNFQYYCFVSTRTEISADHFLAGFADPTYAVPSILDRIWFTCESFII